MGVIRATALSDPSKPPTDAAILDDTRLYPVASLLCDRASAAGFDSLDSIVKVLQNPQTAVMPDDPRYKTFQSLSPIDIKAADLGNYAYVKSTSRIYRIVATGEAGRVKKKITVIVDTGQRPGELLHAEQHVRARERRHPVLARGINGMSHTICGIDLGAFSIKLVLLEVGFRQTHLRGLLETAVPSGDAPLFERQADAIKEAFSKVSAEATPYLALPGDMLSIRLLELPFSDPRKVDQVVGYELEGQIVHPLDEVVFDHTVVKVGDEGSTVLACAAKRDEIAQYLATLEAHGTEPRALYAAPVVYRSLSSATPGARAGRRRRGRDPVPGDPRPRPPAHQPVHRARGAGDHRAHDQARRLPPDDRDRAGVRLDVRARRDGQAHRRAHRHPGAARRRRRSRSSSTRCCARRWCRWCARSGRPSPASAPPRRRPSTRC